MNHIPRFRFGRAFGVLVLLAAWLAMSNHCALALIAGLPMQAAAAVEKSCCPSQDSNGEHQPGSPPSGVCCKSLRVVPADGGAKLVKAQDFPISELVWVILAELSAPEGSRPLELAGTGPPEVRSFAEVVLQRSLLTHAPPFAA